MSSNNNKLTLIIDGTNMFFRCYDMIHPQQTTQRYLLSFGNVLKLICPNECIFVFDSSGGTKRRKALYKQYKSNRNNKSKYQLGLLTDIQNILKIFPVKMMLFNDTQADDVISELAKRISKDNQVLISSSDMDFLQLVNQNIKIWHPINKVILDQKFIIQKYSIHPRNFILYKALVGDKSDNVPGLKGVGLKTLVKYYGDILKEQYPIDGSLMQFIKYVKQHPSPIQQNIIQNSQQVKTFYKIMDLSQGCISPQIGMKIVESYDKTRQFIQSDRLKIYKQLSQKTKFSDKMNLSTWVNDIINVLQRY